MVGPRGSTGLGSSSARILDPQNGSAVTVSSNQQKKAPSPPPPPPPPDIFDPKAGEKALDESTRHSQLKGPIFIWSDNGHCTLVSSVPLSNYSSGFKHIPTTRARGRIDPKPRLDRSLLDSSRVHPEQSGELTGISKVFFGLDYSWGAGSKMFGHTSHVNSAHCSV